MGQATILSHLGGGLYRVKLLFANGIVTARIAAIGLQITALDAQITELEGQKNAAYTDLQTALDSMNDYLGSVTPEQLATDPTAINALTKEAFTARAHYDTLAMRWRMAKSKKTALETNRSYLQNYCPSDITVDAWSVSFNEDLTGNAATIEVDYVLQRNSGKGMSIVNDSGIWLLPNAAVDSRLQHPMSSSEHAVWFNLCVAPAMQRDRPRYRVATLSNIDKILGTCTVSFGGTSAIDNNKLAPEKPIFPKSGDTAAATFDYPPCNSTVFQNGDRVIVKNGNVVIGFYSNPRPCPVPFVITFNIFNTQADVIGSAVTSYSPSPYPYTDTEFAYNSTQITTASENPDTATKIYPIHKNGVEIGRLTTSINISTSTNKTGVYTDFGGENYRNVSNSYYTDSNSVDFNIEIDGVLNITKTLTATLSAIATWNGQSIFDFASFSGSRVEDSLFRITFTGTYFQYYKILTTSTYSGSSSDFAPNKTKTIRTIEYIDTYDIVGNFVYKAIISDTTTTDYSNDIESFVTYVASALPPPDQTSEINTLTIGVAHKPITQDGIINI